MRAVELSPGAPPARAPTRGELHLLLIDLREAAAAEAALRCCLSRDEIERAGRFLAAHARSRFVLTRGWLRASLARCLGATPERLTFSYGANGKPSLSGEWRRSELSFNVSHSADHALIGLATGRAVGVDIEQIRPMPDVVSIASGYFSGAESRAIMARPEGERLRAFFDCWTRKEAFMKATGEGMRIALDAFSVTLDDADSRGVVMANAPATETAAGEGWTVRGLSLAPECAAAVAVQGAAGSISAWREPPMT
jgi:4'-phosphopantetheinyl transferase